MNGCGFTLGADFVVKGKKDGASILEDFWPGGSS
jgi:hypothetical protein